MVIAAIGSPAVAQAPMMEPLQPERTYLESYNPPLILRIPSPKTYCSCVLYAKAMDGISESLGNAGNIKPRYQTPSLGAIVLLSEGGGHAAIVIEIRTDTITIKESNFVDCTPTTRTLNISDPQIRGYW